MTATTTEVPSYFREATRTGTGAWIAPSPDMKAPAWLVADRRTPKEVRAAFAALDAENTNGLAAWEAAKAARKAVTDFDDEVHRATHRGEDGPEPAMRDGLVRSVEKAEGALRVQVDTAFRAARKAEDALWHHRDDLRRLAATVAVEAHDRATAALAEWKAAIDQRDAAYTRAGRPQSRTAGHTAAGLDYRRVTGLPSRLPLARQDVAKATEGFPRQILSGIGDGSLR